MAMNTDRDGVQKLLEQGAQLVEVLPAKDYEAERIPGAINIPLKALGSKAALKRFMASLRTDSQQRIAREHSYKARGAYSTS